MNANLGAASGLLFALTSVATYLSGDATAAFAEFATFISIGGTFGLALDTLIKMFSLDGGLGLKQTMTQVAEYMAGDFTTTFTNFGTFISIGGTFGDALDKLIKTLSQDGNASNALSYLIKDKNLIVVAHRLHTIVGAYAIMVLNKGNIDSIGKT